MIYLQNFINGIFQNPISGKWLENTNPATGQVYSMIPDSNEQDVESAYLAASEAFPSWSKMDPYIRAQHIQALAQYIEDHLEEFAAAESNDSGKPISASRSLDIPRSVQNLRFYAAAGMHFASESHYMEAGAINYTLRRPLGVVGCISPWNLPLYLFTWKWAPALATGNTVVAKPSEVTPFTAWMLSKGMEAVGFPKGVLNIVHGTGLPCGEAMVVHPGIKAISFTGGTSTGKRIGVLAAEKLKKVSLELGGKNPTVIFEDFPLEKTSEIVRAAFSNNGQICLCGSRVIVHEKIYDQFLEIFLEKTKTLKVGNPLIDTSTQGSLVSKSHFEKVIGYIELAKAEGGKVMTGGKILSLPTPNENGFFLEPTVITGLSPSCRTNQEEIFGPVVTIMSFSTEEEAIQIANGTDYGLAASVWTPNIDRALRVAEEIQSGIVWINTWMFRDLRIPFGGMKQSGMGREGGWESMRFFTEAKNVCVKYKK
jgi:aminomuconate-semialdehyde/2-hydroxymuconate-6-semialdehyde dehydrogenase